MIAFPEVSKEMVTEFMAIKENKDLVDYIEQWFRKKTEERNLNDILCLIQSIAILCGIAGKEMAELQAYLNETNQKYDA